MNTKDSIIFYISHFNIIKDDLTDEQLGKLFRTIFKNVETSKNNLKQAKQTKTSKTTNEDLETIKNNLKQPNNFELDDKTIMAYKFIINQIITYYEKYMQTVEKRRISGQKGGAPIGNSNATKTSKTNKTSKNKQNNLNDNENDNDNDNNINIFILSLEKEIKKKISDDEKSNIKLWFETFDGEVIKAAFNIAKRNNKMSIGYIDGILNNWKIQGKTKSSDFKTDIINTVNNQTENISKAELTEDQKQLMNYDWLGDTDG